MLYHFVFTLPFSPESDSRQDLGLRSLLSNWKMLWGLWTWTLLKLEIFTVLKLYHCTTMDFVVIRIQLSREVGSNLVALWEKILVASLILTWVREPNVFDISLTHNFRPWWNVILVAVIGKSILHYINLRRMSTRYKNLTLVICKMMSRGVFNVRASNFAAGSYRVDQSISMLVDYIALLLTQFNKIDILWSAP